MSDSEGDMPIVGKRKAQSMKDFRKAKKSESKNMSKYINKQRTLVFSTRGINNRDRHLMQDIRDLLPHAKKDVKLDAKDKLNVVNEVCELKNCNNCIFFESRKHKDLYMWVSKVPTGPSIKFCVENVHTMAETKLTGNCLKGSRPLLSFGKEFDSNEHYRLIKETLIQVFGTPKGHPKAKPFVDHVFSFFLLDGRVWFRNYQIVYEVDEQSKKDKDPVLIEIGPRFVLNPVRVFDGSFGGSTLWANPDYVSPNQVRNAARAQVAMKYDVRKSAKAAYAKKKEEAVEKPSALDNVF